MHSKHETHDTETKNIIGEKSWQDFLLSTLAVLSLLGLLATGYYWQTLPLPTVEAEESTR